jgi:hypothetical protein
MATRTEDLDILQFGRVLHERPKPIRIYGAKCVGGPLDGQQMECSTRTYSMEGGAYFYTSPEHYLETEGAWNWTAAR